MNERYAHWFLSVPKARGSREAESGTILANPRVPSDSIGKDAFSSSPGVLCPLVNSPQPLSHPVIR